MNLGQILETHLGWAADQGWNEYKGETKAAKGAKPGTLISTPVFDGADEDEIHEILRNVNPNRDGNLLVVHLKSYPGHHDQYQRTLSSNLNVQIPHHQRDP